MKNVILAMIGILITLYTIVISFQIMQVQIHKNTLDNCVARIVENHLENGFAVRSNEEVRQAITQDIMASLGAETDVAIDVRKIDMDKGIISICVSETFSTLSGQKRTISCAKTAIVEREDMTVSAVSHTSKVVRANGDAFTNAQAFYEAYGNEMVFQSGANKEGIIYYGTKAKKAVASTSVTYFNLGWKVTIKNASGEIVDVLYYALGGENLVEVDSRTINGYGYTLYKVTLSNMRSRMSKEAQEAVSTANCQIVFDACTIVRKKGEPQGGLTDEGISWGTVYTTYDGIVNAQNWSQATKKNLESYYNKTIDEMFYQVTVRCGSGISKVSGGGRYCFGTTVTVEATPQEGYRFKNWSGSLSGTNAKMKFTLYDEDITLVANGEKSHAPEISGSDLYVSLKDAQGGKITEDWIADYVEANDVEDGRIPYGRNSKNAFYIENYRGSDFVSLKAPTAIEEKLYAVDSDGNEVRDSIVIHVVDPAITEVTEKVKVRFISGKYYRDDNGHWISEEDGGLQRNSIWKNRAEYRALLDALL